MNLSTLADSNGNSAQLNGLGTDAGNLAKQAVTVTAGIATGNTVYKAVSNSMGSTKGALGTAKKIGAAFIGVLAGLATNKIGAKILKTDQM